VWSLGTLGALPGALPDDEDLQRSGTVCGARLTTHCRAPNPLDTLEPSPLAFTGRATSQVAQDAAEETI
jgi:hypothetical protein